MQQRHPARTQSLLRKHRSAHKTVHHLYTSQPGCLKDDPAVSLCLLHVPDNSIHDLSHLHEDVLKCALLLGDHSLSQGKQQLDEYASTS